MYNKTYRSTAKNSSFLKCFLVRLLCKRKPVNKRIWRQLSLFQPLKNSHICPSHICPTRQWIQLLSRLPWNCHKAAFFFFQVGLLASARSGLDRTAQPGVHSAPRARLTEQKQKIPSVQQGDLLGMKRADARSASEAKHEWGWSRPLVLPTGGRGREKKKTKWRPRRPGNLNRRSASAMEQLPRRFSDMLQPLWHKYSTLHTASPRLLNLVK